MRRINIKKSDKKRKVIVFFNKIYHDLPIIGIDGNIVGY